MRRWLSILVGVLALNALTPAAILGQHTSPNYTIEEFNVGSGGEIDANSPGYNLRGSIGDLGIGNATSTNYQLWAGYTTSDEPFIEMVVQPGDVNLGILNPTTSGTGTATFYVRSYLSHGYIVTTASDPPRNGNHTVATYNNTLSPGVGTEGFGINLKDNSSPDIGSDPIQNPDDPGNPFGFGDAAGNYANTNRFTYNNGDTIASSPQSSGRTDYTVSYLMNVSEVTPGGVYTMTHVLVATGTY